MFEHTYNKKIENKRGAEAPLLIICSKNYYFFVKNDATKINTINPTKPPSPNPFTNEVKLAIASIPNTDPPVKTYHKIVTGMKAINNDPNPPKNPFTSENTFSIFDLPVLRGLFLINT